MLKPYSFLLYFLSIIASFFIGVTYAGLIEAGKGQMLAGGAIVLGYGVMAAGIGLVLSLFMAYKLQRKSIVKTNIVLTIAIVAFWGYYYNKYLEKQKERELDNQKIEQPKTIAPITDTDTAMQFVSEKEAVHSKTNGELLIRYSLLS